MIKDIFIDASIASGFARPKDDEHKELIDWILAFDKNNLESNAYLVTNQKLIEEYKGACGTSYINTSIAVIIDKLIQQKRLIKFTKGEIEEFKAKHYTVNIRKKIRCNFADKEFHIPTVLLSTRRYALIEDGNFQKGLRNFPKFNVCFGKRPKDVPYKD